MMTPQPDCDLLIRTVAEAICAALIKRGLSCSVSDGHRIAGIATNVRVKAQYGGASRRTFNGVRIIVGTYTAGAGRKQFPPRKGGPDIEEIANYIVADNQREALARVRMSNLAAQGVVNHEASLRLEALADSVKDRVILRSDSTGLSLVIYDLTEKRARAILEFLAGVPDGG